MTTRRLVGLLVLSAVPLFAAVTRLLGLATGTPELEGAARFSAAPLTAVLHIVGLTTFFTVGAFQFLPSLQKTSWHRRAGRVLAVGAVVGALTGVWMVWRWEPKQWDSPALNAVRVVIAVAIVGFVVTSVRAARRRDFTAHAAWMTRAWALCAGAGTQVLTMSVFIVPGFETLQSRGSYALLMSAGWGINALVAEWVLARPSLRSLEVAS